MKRLSVVAASIKPICHFSYVKLSVETDKKMNFSEKPFGFPMIKGLGSQSLLFSFEPIVKVGARAARLVR